MDQQELIPTGEASKRYDPAETTEGTYFALSYRGKRVCIDSGINHILRRFLNMPADAYTLGRCDYLLAAFLKDYPKAWWKHPRTGEMLELVKLTSCTLKVRPPDMDAFTFESFQNVLALSPHYKVPNDQSMGRAPLHIGGASQEVCRFDPFSGREG